MLHDDPHLSPERAGALAAGENPAGFESSHLAGCAACRARLDRARAMLGLLQTPALDEFTARRVESALLRRLEVEAAPSPGQRERRLAWAAAGLALVMGAGVFAASAPRQDSSPSASSALLQKNMAPASPSPPQCLVSPAPSETEAWLGFEEQVAAPEAPVKAPPARPRPIRARAAAARARQAAPPSAPTSTVAWGETTVTRRSPSDPFAALLLEGFGAHADGRHEEADAIAIRALGLAETKVQSLSAWRLACESRIAGRRPSAAIEACEHLLEHPNPERVRTTHFMLGTLHRTRLGDCEAAIEHYGQALVFGVPSLYTQEALRFRAECALELGRLDAAEADLERLASQPGLVSRWEEVEALQARLRQARAAATKRERER